MGVAYKLLINDKMAEKSGEDEELYCICRQPYRSDDFMIECDKCNDWFHG